MQPGGKRDAIDSALPVEPPGTRPPVDAAAVPQIFWDTSSDMLVVADQAGVLAAVNPRWRSTLGWNVAEHPEVRLFDLVHVADRPAVREALAVQTPGVRFEDYDVRLRTTDGEYREVRCSGVGDGRFWYISGRDVTEQRRRDADERAQAVMLEQSEIAIVGVDAGHRITRWSAGAVDLYGWTAEEALGESVMDLIDARPVEAVDEDGAVAAGRFESRHKDGSLRVAQVRYTELVDDDGSYAGTISVAMDVSAHVLAETERRTARDHLQAVTRSMTEGLFALSPDGTVLVMNRAAERLLGWSPEEVRGRTLHEITGHLICPMSDDTGPAPGAGLRVVDAVFARRDGGELPVTYTLTTPGPADGTDGWVLVFRDATHARAEQERLGEELRALVWAERADADLAQERLVLHAQPIVDLRTMAVVRHELLLRVSEADGSLSAPQDYLAAAESHGLAGRIDRWVLRRAIDLVAQGRVVDVNVSGTSIGDTELVPDIAWWLDESGADPALLVVEITETAVIADVQAGRDFVDQVHALGCRVALDDFGAGYSGFAYLKQLPVDDVKIDIAFVSDLVHSEASRHVVEAVVTLARGMGLRTVAEGVEDAATLELLVALGVDLAQGYHLGRPAPW